MHWIKKYDEISGYSTKDFVLRAVIYFGYIPKYTQTDNSLEFTDHREILLPDTYLISYANC